MAGLSLAFIAWVGALVALVAILPYGVFVALVSMPIGGSLSALAAGLYLAYQRRDRVEG